MSGFLQKFEITKSSEILTPKSKQKYLQTEIEKVYFKSFRFGQSLLTQLKLLWIYFIALTFSKRSAQFKKIQRNYVSSNEFSKQSILTFSFIWILFYENFKIRKN